MRDLDPFIWGVGGINAYMIAYCSKFKSILLGSFWIVCEWYSTVSAKVDHMQATLVEGVFISWPDNVIQSAAALKLIFC